MTNWNQTDEKMFVVKTGERLATTTEYVKSSGISIILCLKGTANIIVDTREHVLVKNSQLVILPSSIIEVPVVGEEFRMLYIGCSENIFNDMSNSLEMTFFNYIRMEPCVVLPIEEADLLKEMAYLIRVAYDDENNPYRRQMAFNYFQNMLFHFYNRTRQFFEFRTEKWISRKEELFKLFIRLVHQYCATEHDATFYAQKMNITPRYLSSIVLAASGETTKSIIDRHVIIEIKIMLKNSKLNMQEIANAMNFNDPSFFGRYFKKHTGMSPMQYRNNI